MDVKQIKDIVTDLSKQIMGEDNLSAVESYDLVTIGKSVLDSSISTEKFCSALVDRISRVVIMAKKYVGSMPWLYVDSLLWGAFVERVYFDYSDLIDDPSIAPIANTDYSNIEHKFYGTKAMVKLFGKSDGYMLPVSIQKRALRKAFTSETEMNAFITGLELNVQNQLSLAYEVFRKAIVCDGIAVAIKNTENVRHLLSEYNTIFDKNLTADEFLNDADALTWLSEQISITRDNMETMSKVFNNGDAPTFTNKNDSRLLLLNVVDKAIKFKVKADTYHNDLIGVGDFESITAWQGSKETGSDAFDYDTVSKIMLSADDNNSLGIGTDAVTLENVIGFLFDKDALGFTNIHSDVTTSYTASADFWNYFHHRECYGIVDPLCNMVAFVLD